MGSLNGFLEHMDWFQLFLLLIGAVACLFCITFHELAHGFAAYQLGDPTAKVNGRLTLNPISHIDWIGLMLLLTVRVGWAKPVPVDMRNFRNPKAGMAATALAGPISNFLLALVCICLGGFVLRDGMGRAWSAYVLLFLCQLAVLNVGLGVFNLIPIPPLDGSKVLAVLLPDRLYGTWMHYERYGMLVLLALSFAGIGSGFIDAAINSVYSAMSILLGMPF